MKKPDLSLAMVFAIMEKDERITLWHLGICLALFMFWQEQGCKTEIFASRKKVMMLTRIRSIVTYHKCIAELTNFGYLYYQPSYDPFKGSSFRLLLNHYS